MTKVLSLGFFLTVLTLSGCDDTPGMSGANKPAETIDPAFVEELYVESLPFAFALQVARRCVPILIKEGAQRSEELRLLKIAKAEGVRSTKQLFEVLGKVNKRRIQQDGIAFLEEHGIVVTDSASWCEAGQKMIARNDKYGRFLVSAKL